MRDFHGIKPAVTAIVVQATYRIGSRALKNNWLWAIAAASFVAIFALNLPFPIIVLAAAIIGYVGGRIQPTKFAVGGGGHGSAKHSFGPALVYDDTPTPLHAQFRWGGLITVFTIDELLWLIPMAILMTWYGWTHTLTQIGWFFTKETLLTFGGAYAVLPYAYQGGVTHYGWLTPTQMIDGLALGETTPGPLIMVVAFVGFVGGYVEAVFGPDMLCQRRRSSGDRDLVHLPAVFPVHSGGGPLMETTHGNLKFTGPLTAITAAVVGVILNLALFFGYHVLWPQGFAGRFDWIAAAIAASRQT